MAVVPDCSGANFGARHTTLFGSGEISSCDRLARCTTLFGSGEIAPKTGSQGVPPIMAFVWIVHVTAL